MNPIILVFLSLIFSGSFVQAAEVSITMDDFSLKDSSHYPPTERNKRILGAFKKHKIKSALYVTCANVEGTLGRRLLKKWSEAGHLIGNHTYTHPRYGSKISFEEFSKDVYRCHKTIENFGGFERWFRFPNLAEGDTIEKRDLMRNWLVANDYKNAHVTIDASDWYIDQRLREKLQAQPDFDLTKFRDFYLQHMWSRSQYYNELSKRTLGREVKHTLVIHFNLLNALFLDDLISMFKMHQWKIVDANQVFTDPVYMYNPQSMPSGQSLIWAIAKESSKFEQELRYPGEDGKYEKAEMDKLGL